MSKTSNFDLKAFQNEVLNDPLVYDIWNSKYRLPNELNIEHTRRRVARALFKDEETWEGYQDAMHYLTTGLLIPAGRINAGMDSGRRVTALNCFVTEIVQDSLPGIQRAISRAAFTMQQGGGVGTDFSTIRPQGARVNRTGSFASGPLSFADQMDSMCTTIESAGQRRGALMLTLCLHKSTKIHTLNGNIEISKLVGQRPYLFACDPLTKKTHIVQAGRVFVSGYNRKVIRIKFDTRDELVCTPDHLIMRKDGSYCPASELSPGDRVTAIKHGCKISADGRPTETVITTGYQGQAHYVHHLVSQDVLLSTPKGYDVQVHHKDENRLNNDPSNLEVVSAKEHAARHVNNLTSNRIRINSERKGKSWDEIYGEERAAKLRAKHKQSLTKAWEEGRHRPLNPEPNNHIVIAIEDAGIADQVYDISLPKWHNFAANSVFVHNCDTHPDIWHEDQYETRKDQTGRTVLAHPSFISAKRQPGRLTQFNVSILVSEEFMSAISEDADWDLGFHVPRADGQHVDVYDKPFPYDYEELDNNFNAVARTDSPKKGDILPWYVYKRVKARRIWEDIMQSTYKYAEPGILFIDRINEYNNLNYCEDIRSTNPCSEQPLPPAGCCCLGSVNLAFMVKNPFTSNAEFNFSLYQKVIRTGVRMLDNVLDISDYPLEQQKNESAQKRRIGLGITGLGDALLQLGIRYGSAESVEFSDKLASTLQAVSYSASAELARVRGPFLQYDKAEFAKSLNLNNVPSPVLAQIEQHGIRNGVANTIAPNGCRPVTALTTTNCGVLTLEELLEDHTGVWCDFNKNTRVIQQDNTTSAINRTYSNGVAPVYRIKTTYGLCVESTANHPWWVNYRLGSKKGPYDRIPVNNWVETTELRINDVLDVQLGVYKNERHSELLFCPLPTHGNAVPIKQPDHMSEQLAWLLGYLWGNGALSITKWRTRFSSYHKAHIEKCQTLFRELFGLDTKIFPTPNQNSWETGVGSKHLWDWLHLNGCSKYDEGSLAFISRVVRSSAYNDIIAFFAGLVDADGYVCLDSRKTSRTLAFGTTDARFAQHLQDVCWAVGLGISRTPDTAGRSFQGDRNMWRCTLSSWVTTEAFGILSRNSEKIKSSDQSFSFTHQRKAKNCGLTGKIISVEYIGDKPTFDLEVANEPWFYAGSVKSHNTISIYTGNVASGLEPVFSFQKTLRNVRQGDGSRKQYSSVNYAYRLYEAMFGETPVADLPDYFVGADQITPREHINVLAAWQKYIDSSISKTINCATNLDYEAFKEVYAYAYAMGCKGCTTYRYDPDSGRGSVLITEADANATSIVAAEAIVPQKLVSRPEILEGRTYKIKFGAVNWYITITHNNETEQPMELFITTKDSRQQEWVQALSLVLTAILRRGGDIQFLIDELKEVVAATGGAWIGRKYVPSIVAAIAGVIEQEFMVLGILSVPAKNLSPNNNLALPAVSDKLQCPKCGAPSWIKEAGCWHCLSCDHSTCG